jgi:hypothetical protein
MSYNGWANRQTWNVSLHINNVADTYEQARGFMVDYEGKNPYQDFVNAYGYISTIDGILFDDAELDIVALNAMMGELL